MKKLIPFSFLALLLAACNSDPKPAETTTVNPLDTAGLAEYQARKAAGGNEIEPVATPAPAPQQNVAATPRRTPRPAAARPVVTPAPTPTAPTGTPTAGTGTTGDGSTAGIGTGTGTTAEAPKKKGISNTAKGAIIGGVGGAAAGAIINKKNRGAGAIIGGVLGAGAGAVIGNKTQKKDSTRQ